MTKLASPSLIEKVENLRLDGTSAELVDQLIAALGLMRERLQPPVRLRDPLPGEPVEAQIDPRWWIAPEAFVDGVLLQIRHPRFGWLAFALPLQSVRELHGSLGNLLELAERETQGRAVN